MNLKDKAQKVFNAWVKRRDDLGGYYKCISCGKIEDIKLGQASHYFSMGHHSGLRYDERNVHLSCKHCNMFLHGNLINYRKGLVLKFGEDFVNDLENDGEVRKVKKWHDSELNEIINTYK